jgi:hypothetical protein
MWLIIVPKKKYNVLFVAFNTNPTGSHLNSCRTFHHLGLRHYWPGMYSYIKGCALHAQDVPLLTQQKKNHPNWYIISPSKLHSESCTDDYSAGVHFGFKGSPSYLISSCGMCSFGILEQITGATTFTFASTIMKMQLCSGFFHTVVLDKNSKFFSICRESLNLLKINCHVLSGDNLNPILVKRLCQHFNKGLRIMTHELNLVHVVLEALLLLLYAWNSCPVPGCIGKLEFSFTGPWWVIDSADGGSYNNKHCHHPTWCMKKQAPDLTPYPAELIPLNPSMAPIPSIANSKRPSTLILLKQ